MIVWQVRFTNKDTKNSFECESPFSSKESAELFATAACTLGNYTYEVFALEEETCQKT